MLIFLDTEFTDLGIDPKLISIGLVDESGAREFYAEVVHEVPSGGYTDFVREAVLPYMGPIEQRIEWHQLVLALGNWVESFETPVTIATDSLSWDWPWVQELFCGPGTWPENLDRSPLLLTMNYLIDYYAFITGVEESFVGGLRRHHALDDAKANRLGWLASEGMQIG